MSYTTALSFIFFVTFTKMVHADVGVAYHSIAFDVQYLRVPFHAWYGCTVGLLTANQWPVVESGGTQ
jgi:hypothetical protein